MKSPQSKPTCDEVPPTHSGMDKPADRSRECSSRHRAALVFVELIQAAPGALLDEPLPGGRASRSPPGHEVNDLMVHMLMSHRRQVRLARGDLRSVDVEAAQLSRHENLLKVTATRLPCRSRGVAAATAVAGCRDLVGQALELREPAIELLLALLGESELHRIQPRVVWQVHRHPMVALFRGHLLVGWQQRRPRRGVRPPPRPIPVAPRGIHEFGDQWDVSLERERRGGGLGRAHENRVACRGRCHRRCWRRQLPEAPEGLRRAHGGAPGRARGGVRRRPRRRPQERLEDRAKLGAAQRANWRRGRGTTSSRGGPCVDAAVQGGAMW
mmetsp:Transcript_44438/g.142449  ORF Transcript_44438/g.142449 Transcript_44438/m.142449 type:complete len:327 (+) Transcript_44438:151-1131(+)